MPHEQSLCVVVSYYDARQVSELFRLLRQLRHLVNTPNAHQGFTATVAVCVNSAHGDTLNLPAELSGIAILHRANNGFNMGAWDHGWRNLPGYRNYLFLQDECIVGREDALNRYWRLLELGHGSRIVGESYQAWRSWKQFNRRWPAGGAAVSRMADHLGIPLGKTPSHLQTLALAMSGEALSRLDGFILADDKIEAISTEVLFSQKALAIGLTLRQSAWRPFEYFRHEQWSGARSQSARLSWHLAKVVRLARQWIAKF